jgi:hypothetical protein
VQDIRVPVGDVLHEIGKLVLLQPADNFVRSRQRRQLAQSIEHPGGEFVSRRVVSQQHEISPPGGILQQPGDKKIDEIPALPIQPRQTMLIDQLLPRTLIIAFADAPHDAHVLSLADISHREHAVDSRRRDHRPFVRDERHPETRALGRGMKCRKDGVIGRQPVKYIRMLAAAPRFFDLRKQLAIRLQIWIIPRRFRRAVIVIPPGYPRDFLVRRAEQPLQFRLLRGGIVMEVH